MIRLRQSLEAALRHPLLGPLVMLLLALVLGFLALHTIEHGVEGLLFSCALAVAIGFRLLIVSARTWRVRPGRPSLFGRAPPVRAFRLLPPVTPGRVSFAVPLRL